MAAVWSSPEQKVHRDDGADRTQWQAIAQADASARRADAALRVTWGFVSASACTHMTADSADRIAAFLDTHHVASLATCGPEGAHAANVFYVRDGFALLWVSDPKSRHSANLEIDGRVAATVAPDYFDIDDIRGVQISGRANTIVDSAHRSNARLLLEARYPGVRQMLHESSALREAYSRMEFYRLEPSRVVLIDNSRGFGHKDVLELSTGHRPTTGVASVREGSDNL